MTNRYYAETRITHCGKYVLERATGHSVEGALKAACSRAWKRWQGIVLTSPSCAGGQAVEITGVVADDQRHERAELRLAAEGTRAFTNAGATMPPQRVAVLFDLAMKVRKKSHVGAV